MSRLGLVLELLHDPQRRFQTVRLAGRSAAGEWRLWWQGSDRCRLEEEGPQGTSISLQAGPQWWSRSSSGEVRTNDGRENQHLGVRSDILELLHPRPLLGVTVLEYLGQGEVAGRRAALLTATARRWQPGISYGSWSPGSPEPFRVAIDLERGVALRAPGVEVTEAVFDESFEDEIFAPLRGEQADRVVHVGMPPRGVPPESLAELVPFTVLLPGLLPEGARLTACWVDPGDDPPRWVTMGWIVDPGGRARLSIRQGPDVAAERGHGERIVERGVERWVERSGLRDRYSQVWLERDATPVVVETDLPAEIAVGIALSLRARR